MQKQNKNLIPKKYKYKYKCNMFPSKQSNNTSSSFFYQEKYKPIYFAERKKGNRKIRETKETYGVTSVIEVEVEVLMEIAPPALPTLKTSKTHVRSSKSWSRSRGFYNYRKITHFFLVFYFSKSELELRRCHYHHE
eukprot:TRINITY_DN35315_c0_g2_i2.p1 TRINITY_DN35315_c0_g2~~TRINITY_DN35315_c0_g2_i2.p1  ORF type:complete len:136 (-),score=12.52 TRINITY_DN35315_c0_g2_i2:381-788(-)